MKQGKYSQLYELDETLKNISIKESKGDFPGILETEHSNCMVNAKNGIGIEHLTRQLLFIF